MSDEWYYVDKNGGQQGPVGKPAFSAAYAAGTLDGECLCWNATMSGWLAIKDVAEVKALVQPVARAAPAPAARGPAPTPAARGPAPTPAGRGPAPTPAKGKTKQKQNMRAAISSRPKGSSREGKRKRRRSTPRCSKG